RTDIGLPDEPAGPERLQKVLAHAGIGSRRACEELILQGRVTVDGKVVRELGTRIEPARSQVAVDGQKVHLERPVYFAVYKPKGYVSTNADPGGRPRVVDLLPEIPQRVYTVGRLDEMSVGLMLLTNDGELANRLAHPKFGVEKVYRALVAGLPTPEVLQQLTEGVWLAEGKVRARRVRIAGRKGEATVLEMVLAEGKNREVRRMLARLGHKVMSLVRVAIGPITLRGLSVGQWRHLAAPEVDLLRRVAAGESLPAPSPVRGDRRPRRRPVDEAREPAPSGPAAGPGPAPQRRPSRPSVSASRPTVTPRPSGPQRRPAGPARGPSGGPRRPAAGAGIGPARGPGTRPPRPQGPPSRRPAPPPAPEPPTRRIIGLEPEGPSGPPSGPGSRRPVPKRRAPGAASRRRPRPLVPRRRTRPSTEGGEEA
ncbi:MAG TPA: pseudouridine synthase, partial [Isosphaeraceae bacterium]